MTCEYLKCESEFTAKVFVRAVLKFTDGDWPVTVGVRLCEEHAGLAS